MSKSDPPPHRPSAGRSLIANFLAWALAGAAVGLCVGVASVHANPSVRPGADARQLSLLVAALFALTLAALALPGTLLAGLAAGRALSFGERFLVGLATWLGYAACQWAIDASPWGWKLELSAPRLWSGAAGALGGCLGAALLLGRLRAPVLTRAWLLAGLAPAALLALPSAPEAPPAEAPTALPAADAGGGPRVVLLGLDGVDPARFDELARAGRIPHLAGLRERGFLSPLTTTVPTWSPILWTSIATGVPEAEHGIYDFTEFALPGLDWPVQRLRKTPLLPHGVGLVPLAELWLRREHDAGRFRERPVSSLGRRRASVWNAVDRAGRRAGVVNWFASFPSEVLEHGFLVSDNNPWRHAFLSAKHGAGQSTAQGICSPESLLAELVPLVVEADGSEMREVTNEEVLASPFFDGVGAAEKKRYLEEFPGSVSVFRLFQNTDRFAVSAGLYLWREKQVDLLALYLSGIDNASHRFHRHASVIDAYYEWVDGLVGELLEATDERTTFVIASDHGWEYEAGALLGHEHGPDGVLLVSGAGARRGAELPWKPSLIDVAPTVLALLGLPIPEEMEGRPVRAGLTAEVLASLPERRAYGPYRPRWHARDAGEGDAAMEETLQKLEDLGYIDLE